MIVSLTGFMGCGKSSVGKVLSRMLDCPLVDLDDWIEEVDGRSITEIFAEDGEEIFREMELLALRSILSEYEGEDVVLSLGGGTLTGEECRELVHEGTECFYLKAEVDTLVENLLMVGTENRPMLKGYDLRERITELMGKREGFYSETSHHTVTTDGKDSEGIALEIKSLLGK